jgi:hypothetical protein
VTASQRSEHGYVVEVAIPEAYLAEQQGSEDGSWEAIRIDLSVRDFDEGEVGHSELWWRPSRFGSQAVVGSGTFVRSE